MKKITVLLIMFLTVSCSNEDLDDLKTNTNLVSIQENQYQDAQLFRHKTLNFADDKLINIEYESDEQHDEYSYNDKGLVSKIIEFWAAGGTLMTTTFVYDDKGRIIEYNRIPGPYYPISTSTKYAFTFLSDKILCTTTYESKNPETVEILLTNNSITKENVSANYYFTYGYSNSNLASTSLFENNKLVVNNASTYSYSTLKNEYNYKKFVFGKEWKLNSFLSSTHKSKRSMLTDLSENLVSEFTDTYPDQIINSKFDYVINDKNQIEKQVRTYTSTTNGVLDVTIKYELLYTYK